MLVLVLAEKSVMLLLLFLVAVAVSPAEILPALVPARQHNPVVEKADANYRLFSSTSRHSLHLGLHRHQTNHVLPSS